MTHHEYIMVRPANSRIPRPLRLRFWEAAGRPVVVLVEEIEGSMPPSWVTHKTLYRVYRGLLTFPASPPLFFELERGAIHRVEFEVCGHRLRPWPRFVRRYWVPAREFDAAVPPEA